MSDTVQQIKDRLSIVDVVSGYVKLERAGQGMRARCPFHAERTPSFHVSQERGTYHCFGCGVGGDIFSFVEAIEGLDFKGALKVLAEKAGVEIVYSGGNREEKDEKDRLLELMEVAALYYSSRMSKDAEKYLKERGLHPSTISAFRLGWAGNEWSAFSDYARSRSASGGKFTEKEIVDAGLAKKGERGLIDKFRNRIMFPIMDPAGRVVAFSGRIFGPDASPEAPKYLNSPETILFHKSRILYGFDKAKLSMRKVGCAVLVEGQMDLVASHQAGWGNTVAVSGTAFTPEHAALIKRMTDNIVVALDADAAGIKAAGKAARAALQGGLNVKVAQLPDGMDPADLILKQGVDAWKTAIRDAKDIITFLLDVLEKHAKARDTFRRLVESVVLPFLSDVKSPIAREQYVHEIAARLKVSDTAVVQALAKVPHVPQQQSQSAEAAHAPHALDRVKQAYALLLWQESLPDPMLDAKTYATELAQALGKEEFAQLRATPERDAERMRYEAEAAYAQSRSLKTDALRHIHEIVKGYRLPRVTQAIREAERAGDAALLARLEAERDLLITAIARIGKEV